MACDSLTWTYLGGALMLCSCRSFTVSGHFWLRVTFLVDSLSLLAGLVLNSLRVLLSSSTLPALFLRWAPIPTLVPLWTLNHWRRLVGSGLNIGSSQKPSSQLFSPTVPLSLPDWKSLALDFGPLLTSLMEFCGCRTKNLLCLSTIRMWFGVGLIWKVNQRRRTSNFCVFGIARVCLHCSMSLILQVSSAVSSMPIRMKALTARLETEGGSMEVSITPKGPPVTFRVGPVWPRCTAL